MDFMRWDSLYAGIITDRNMPILLFHVCFKNFAVKSIHLTCILQSIPNLVDNILYIYISTLKLVIDGIPFEIYIYVWEQIFAFTAFSLFVGMGY